MVINPQTKAILFFLGVIVASVLMVAWFTFWNNGTLSITGEPPFTLYIGEDRVVQCTENPCDTVLRPGLYLVTVEKENTFTQKFGITIIRNRTTLQEVQFEQTPQLTESQESHTFLFSDVENIQTNLDSIDTSSLAADVELQPLPDGVHTLSFTTIDGPIIATTDTGVYIAATASARFTKTPLTPTDSWMAGDEKSFYYFTKNTGTSRQALMLTTVSAEGVTTVLDTPKVLSYFEQPIEKAIIREASAYGALYIFDIGGEEGHIYGLNLDTFMRSNLGDLPNIDAVKGLAGSIFVLETRTSRSNVVGIYIFDVTKKIFTEMENWPALGQIVFTGKGTLIAASNRNFLTVGDEETEEQAQTFWYEYNPFTGKYRLLLQEEAETPSSIFIKDNEIHFLRDGKWQTIVVDDDL